MVDWSRDIRQKGPVFQSHSAYAGNCGFRKVEGKIVGSDLDMRKRG